jgi:lipoprotein-releasing system permease protein
LERLNEKAEKIDELLPSNGGGCGVRTLYQTAPQIFDWLEMLNMNVVVILTLIILVAGFNMVSGLLIFILDKTAMIGILKALGVQNFSLRKVFLYVAAGMIVRGLLWGNVLALGLAFLQYYGRFVKLDASVYYMDTVPIDIHVGYVVLLNVGVLFVSVLMLVIPTLLISRITPIKAIRFE